MKIVVSELLGDATVLFYDKSGEPIHSEGFYGKCTSYYVRNVPEWVAEKTCTTKALFTGIFNYKVV